METPVKTPDLNKIIEISGINPLKIRNVYVFGSRVYGYNTEDSDFDIILVAPNLDRNKEIRDKDYNVHIVNPDTFKEVLFNSYKITYLECIFAPDWAKLQEKIKFDDFVISKDKLKKEMLAQSFSAWRNAKQKMIEGDTHRGIKSAFHAFKILMFGMQMAEHGKIINFAEINDLNKEMYSEDFYDWSQIKDKYLSRKIALENKFKTM